MNPETERIEVLLALADAFAGAGADGLPTAEEREGLLTALDEDARQAVRRRGQWLDRLPPEKRRDWLRHTLARARPQAWDAPPLDEHLHHSHVTEALRAEPERVRRLVVAHLPHALAADCARSLGMSVEDARAEAGTEGGAGPAPEVVTVVRRVFLSNFITLAEVERPTPLDFFSGAELARLVRLLGVRETALACRGIAAVEAVAAFLKRFAPEDARALAAHIRTLTNVEPRRVALATRHVHEALRAEPKPGAMLDRVGLRLMATALSGRSRRSGLRYAAQKLPTEAARWLRLMAASAVSTREETDAPDRDEPAEARRLIAREVEEVAAGLRRRPARAQGTRTGRRSGPLAPAPSEAPAGTES